jgi:ribose 5-phosphate isomerase B
MEIVIAADPFAATLKEVIKKHLEDRGHSVVDVGTTEGNDVPFFAGAKAACAILQKGQAERGVLLCGSGMGMAIAAGKHRGIIAACVESVFAARMCRAINNANVLCLGSMIWGEWMAREAVDVFLTTKHTDGLTEIASVLKEGVEQVNAIDESTRR